MERLAADCGASEPVLRSTLGRGCCARRVSFALDFNATFLFAKGYPPCSSVK
jgi:hypothetical protein